ncbi:MAG: glycoside hydrolase family 127 protein [Planctomycetes bacterium]|nr:glycoside hydrolase family 127 protein [Planctomycetota bacterium]
MKNTTAQRILFSLTLATIMLVATCSAAPEAITGIPSTSAKIAPAVELKVQPFDLTQVRILDGPFKDAMQLNIKYLHDLDPDRLLHTFRINASLPTNAEPLGGWERPDCELRGHCTGHFLSGCALAFAQSDDAKLKAKANYVVAELAKCQKALGNTGYLSAYPEEQIDRVEAKDRVWAPYYTLHKIIAGLVDMYMYCDNDQALHVAENMAKWSHSRMAKFTDQQRQQILDATEQGGMNDILRKLYVLTGNKSYLATADLFDQASYNDPLAQHKDNLTGQHANSFIPNIVGTAAKYEITGDQKQRDIVSFFFDRVTQQRMYATGGTSDHEHFPQAGKLAKAVSSNSHESCCTYNMLKLTEHLFRWNPSARYADYYERALYNAILPTIDPDTGMTMYYVAMQSGLFKTFGCETNCFWCCTGSGMENHVKYSTGIYYHDDQSLYVNLFIASKLNWADKHLTLTQNTNFPEEQATTLTLALKKTTPLKIRIRLPYWAKDGVTAKVNGQPQTAPVVQNGYMVLDRKWNNGDKIKIEMPMSLHTHAMNDNPDKIAVMYGPIVLTGKLGTEGLNKKTIYKHYGPRGVPVEVPAIVTEHDNPQAWIKPIDTKSLTFKTNNAAKPNDVTLVPFYKLFHERYAIYWKKQTPQQWAQHLQQVKEKEETEKARQATLIDEVKIADKTSEAKHNLQGKGYLQGKYMERNWIHAQNPSWFSYDLKVDPASPCKLSVTYWGADSGDKTFDILVNNKKIATQTLDSLSPGHFIDIYYDIPVNLTKGKKTITVKFNPHDDNIAGGIFGIATMKK